MGQWSEEQVRAMEEMPYREPTCWNMVGRHGSGIIDSLKEFQIAYNKDLSAATDRMEENMRFFGKPEPLTWWFLFRQEWSYRLSEAWAALRGLR